MGDAKTDIICGEKRLRVMNRTVKQLPLVIKVQGNGKTADYL